jgi:hypothetical protein
MGIASLGASFVPFAGMSYCLIGVVVGATHSRRGKLHRARFGAQEVLEGAIEEERVLDH